LISTFSLASTVPRYLREHDVLRTDDVAHPVEDPLLPFAQAERVGDAQLELRAVV